MWCSLAGLTCKRVVPFLLPPAHDHDADELDTNSFEGEAAAVAAAAARRTISTITPPSLSRACITLPCHADIPAPDSGVSAMGDVRLTILDPENDLRPLPWLGPNHFMAPVTMMDPLSQEPWGLCPRANLQRVIDKLASSFGLSFRVGFEIEFVLADLPTDRGQTPVPIDPRTYSSASAFDAAAPILEEICEALHGLGIKVEQLHKESGPGQYEIVVAHLPVMEAVDGLLFAKQAIVATARRHGKCASFLPKYLADQAGNGCHVHISVWKDGKNLVQTLGEPLKGAVKISNLDGILQYCTEAYNGLPSSKAAADNTIHHFLGGIYAHLFALVCFTTSTSNSFRRLQPSSWAGCYKAWGFGNKEAPLRIPVQTGREGFFTNFEVKLNDATANPYVALAAILCAGLVGLKKKLKLPPPLDVDPAQLSEEERLTLLLPGVWVAAKEAVTVNENSALFREYLGAELVQAHVAVRESEMEAMWDWTLEKEVRFLFGRY